LRIAIVGSREYSDLEQVRLFVDLLPTATVVVSGGARGVDRTAADHARKRGLETEEHFADWNTHGKRAGYIRNQKLVDLSDHVVAFWDLQSKGTKHTIDLAEKAGKLLKVYTVFSPVTL
jgi:hypothetical protein